MKIDRAILVSNFDLFPNSLWPSDAKWRQRSGSTLAQVMACCLMATSHYLNQCWLIISKVQWHPSGSNFSHQSLRLARKYLSKILFKSPRGQWVNLITSSMTSSTLTNTGRVQPQDGDNFENCKIFNIASFHIHVSYWASVHKADEQMDILPQLVKTRSHEILVWTFPITLKFDMHLSSSVAKMLVKFQSDMIIITSCLAASRLQEILQLDVRLLSEQWPWRSHV